MNSSGAPVRATTLLDRLPRHLDVAAERHRADAVFRPAARDLGQLRPEAERERDDADTVPAGHEEVPELVDEHEHTKHEQECESRDHAIEK
jgi:hypothetical protein